MESQWYTYIHDTQRMTEAGERNWFKNEGLTQSDGIVLRRNNGRRSLEILVQMKFNQSWNMPVDREERIEGGEATENRLLRHPPVKPFHGPEIVLHSFWINASILQAEHPVGSSIELTAFTVKSMRRSKAWDGRQGCMLPAWRWNFSSMKKCWDQGVSFNFLMHRLSLISYAVLCGAFRQATSRSHLWICSAWSSFLTARHRRQHAMENSLKHTSFKNDIWMLQVIYTFCYLTRRNVFRECIANMYFLLNQ